MSNSAPYSLAGRRALVTGGTAGVGREVVRLLLEQGCHVLTFALDQGSVDRLAAELGSTSAQHSARLHAVVADASNLDEIRRVFRLVDERLGGLDVLVNNAASVMKEAETQRDTIDAELEQVDATVRTNVTGYIACALEAATRMKENGDGKKTPTGHIVMVGSMSADLREPGSGPYAATKAAIQAYAESLRKRVGDAGIRVSVIEPALIATALPSIPPEEMRQKVEEQTALEARDVAEAILWCLQRPPRSDVVLLQLRPRHQDV